MTNVLWATFWDKLHYMFYSPWQIIINISRQVTLHVLLSLTNYKICFTQLWSIFWFRLHNMLLFLVNYDQYFETSYIICFTLLKRLCAMFRKSYRIFWDKLHYMFYSPWQITKYFLLFLANYNQCFETSYITCLTLLGQ